MRRAAAWGLFCKKGGEDVARKKKAQWTQVLPGVSFRELLTLPVEELQQAQGGSVGQALARVTVSDALEGDQRALGFVTQAVMQEMPKEETASKKGKDFIIEVRILE